MTKEKMNHLQLAAHILGMNDDYKGKKNSRRHSRFSFWFDKNFGCIEVFNAEKGNDLFMWEDECIAVCKALGLSHIVTTTSYPYGEKRLVFRIF